jgi:hypothetical protein
MLLQVGQSHLDGFLAFPAVLQAVKVIAEMSMMTNKRDIFWQFLVSDIFCFNVSNFGNWKN